MSVKLKIFKNMVGMYSGGVSPSIEYDDSNTEEFEKYLDVVKRFEEVFEVEEILFDWDADVASYKMMMEMANDIDAGRIRADEIPANYQQSILQVREMSKLMGATMPSVCLEIRTKGTDLHQPLQIFFADHVQMPKTNRIVLTKFELETLTLGLKKQLESYSGEDGNERS